MNSDEIDQKQIKIYRKSFLALSQLRFSRMESAMSMKQSDCLKLLPLLFHVNHPMLPGYVDKFTPCGLPNYSPSKLEKKIARTVSQSFEYKPRAHLNHKIASLFLMGSTGTLGQSSTSDIDLWICLTVPLKNNLLAKLNKKAALIKDWMATFGIELNYYCVNADDFSSKKVKYLEADSCGNTQNYLLLDEFYRTSVWLVGRWPLWWIIPQDKEYSKHAKRLVSQKHIDSADWIDFGEVKEIPVYEYFSAALWQMYKAIESPYKSCVKLIVLEVYAKSHPCGGLLSNQLKDNVHFGEWPNQELDPYLQILLFAEKALQGSPKRLEFLRRAFYLKVNLKITKVKKRKPSWRYALVSELIDRWNWNNARLTYLNARQSWDIHQIKEERLDLIKELTNSYHFLSGFSRVQGTINQVAKNELLSLGRQLYSAFERKSGKIEIINTGIVNDTYEPAITLFQIAGRWSLYIGHIEQKNRTINRVAFKGRSLFECLCWGCVNGVILGSTRFHVYQQDEYQNQQLASDINKDLIKLFNHFSQLKKQSQFEQDAKIIGFGIFINTQNDPLAQEKRDNLYNIVEGGDCFSWTDEKINLASQFDVVFLNSWGEITTQSYTGESAWVDFYSHHYQAVAQIDHYPIYCRRLVQKDEVVKRVLGVLLNWKKLMLNSHRTGNVNRHLMTVGRKWLMVDLFESSVIYSLFGTVVKLYDGLSSNRLNSKNALATKVHLDPFVLLDGFINSVIKRRLQEGIDFYIYSKTNDLVEVIVRSSNGTIHYQSHKKSGADQIMGHYQQFFDKIQNRNLLNHGLLESVRYWNYIDSGGKSNPRFKALVISNSSALQQFSLVQAIAYTEDNQLVPATNHSIALSLTGFDLYTADSSFYYSELGEKVYLKLQQQLLRMRKSSDNYPIFLTDLDLSAVHTKVSIIDALGYKKKIEAKLNKGIR